MKSNKKIFGAALLAVAALVTLPASQAASDEEAIAVQRATPPDRSGKKRIGVASFYHPMFNGRKMADGKPFDPNGINAASKTLPLGTFAVVTNLETNKSAVVHIQDRGPYVDGRIVDLSPRIAEEIGITRQGLAKVEVTPITVPMPDGTLRIGEAGRDSRMAAAINVEP
jgi:peptidoglycan lytic transglycosylase